MIPQVRALAGGLLASSAVLAVIIGLAAQRTLGNFVAGLLIAITQPIRLGDRVSYAGEDGVIEEIGLTYTFIRTQDQARLVVPNEKLASDTIRNSTIRSREAFAEITVQVPLSADLGAAVDGLREEVAPERDAAVYVSSLDGNAVVTIRAGARARTPRRSSSATCACARTAACARWASGDDAAAAAAAPPDPSRRRAQAPRASQEERSRRTLIAVLIGLPVVVARRRDGRRQRPSSGRAAT